MAMLMSTRSRLDQLQALIAAGWQIEEPVLLRSAYSGTAGRACVFEVVVYYCGERRVVALQDVPEVQSFLSRQELAVLDVS